MQNVVGRYEEGNEVPFAMGSMQEPSLDHRQHAQSTTFTTVYTTSCGPRSTPDDGAVTNKDD